MCDMKIETVSPSLAINSVINIPWRDPRPFLTASGVLAWFPGSNILSSTTHCFRLCSYNVDKHFFPLRLPPIGFVFKTSHEMFALVRAHSYRITRTVYIGYVFKFLWLHKHKTELNIWKALIARRFTPNKERRGLQFCEVVKSEWEVLKCFPRLLVTQTQTPVVIPVGVTRNIKERNHGTRLDECGHLKLKNSGSWCKCSLLFSAFFETGTFPRKQYKQKCIKTISSLHLYM